MTLPPRITVILVGDSKHLIKLVADEEDGAALIAKLPQQCDQFLHLCRRQHRRRLVKNEDIHATVEKPQNLDDLTHMHRGVFFGCVPVEPDACQRFQPMRRIQSPRLVYAAERVDGFMRENEILEQRQPGDQHEFLMHHADAAGKRVGRSQENNRGTVDDHDALVRPVHALEYAHQRRLAGAIAADDRMHRSTLGTEVAAGVGNEGAEPPGDVHRTQADRRVKQHLACQHDLFLRHSRPISGSRDSPDRRRSRP